MKVKKIETKQEFFAEKIRATRARERKGLTPRTNGRSADYIFPSHVIGCELHCAYCYVARHRQNGNPIERYTNLDKLIDNTVTFLKNLGHKQKPTQCHPTRWSIDIGESTDLLSRNNIDSTNHIIQQLIERTECQPTFATKLGHPANVRKLKPVTDDRARIRMSLMPQSIASIVEVGSARIKDRIAGIDAAYDIGYEVHLNFSPIILYEGWLDDYRKLLEEIDAAIAGDVRKQLKCEVIMLTHHPRLHKLNERWLPEAEQLLWRPDLQEYKCNSRGNSDILRYKANTVKRNALDKFEGMLTEILPNCEIRYAF